MNPNEYLDAAKAKIGIESDYELAHRFEMPRQQVSDIRKGKRPMDNATAYHVAIALDLDPAMVIADLEAQREKNPQRREFWAGFIQRAAVVAALVCTLALSFSVTSGEEQAALGGALAASAAVLWLAARVRIICIMLNYICAR